MTCAPDVVVRDSGNRFCCGHESALRALEDFFLRLSSVLSSNTLVIELCLSGAGGGAHQWLLRPDVIITLTVKESEGRSGAPTPSTATVPLPSRRLGSLFMSPGLKL